MLLRKTDIKTIFTFVSFLTGSLLHTTSYADQKNLMSFTTQDLANTAYTTAARDALQVNSEIQRQMNAIKTAKSRFDQLQHVGATSDVHDAKNTLHRSESRYSSTLAKISGVSIKEIDGMHSSGMTWGQVSHEIGVRVNDMVDSELGTQGETFSGNQQKENSIASSVGMDKLKNQGGQGVTQTENITPEYPQNYSTTKQLQEMGINSQEMRAATERNLFSGGVSGHGTDIQSTGIYKKRTEKRYISINEALSNPDEGVNGGRSWRWYGYDDMGGDRGGGMH